MPGLTPLNQETFDSQVRDAGLPVVVAFNASLCGRCKLLTADLVELADQYAGRVLFYSADVQQSPVLVMTCEVMSLPTLILFQDGLPTKRITRYQPKSALQSALLKDS